MNYGKGTDGTVFHSEMGANCGIHRPAGGSAVSDSDSGLLTDSRRSAMWMHVRAGVRHRRSRSVPCTCASVVVPRRHHITHTFVVLG